MPEYEDPFLRPDFDPDDARPNMPGVKPRPKPPVAPDVPDEGLGSSGTISGSDDDLTGITGGYQGLVCEPCSTRWVEAAEQPCFESVSITATKTDGNTVTLTGDAGTDSMYFAMSEGSYAEFTLSINVTGGPEGIMGDGYEYKESIPVRFDAGDSLNVQVGETGFGFFELIKNNQQWISSDTIAALNSNFTKFELKVTLTKAAYCTEPVVIEVEEVEITEDQQSALAGTGDYTPVEIEESPSSSWSQEDSWVLIGGVILLGLAYYLYQSIGSGISE